MKAEACDLDARFWYMYSLFEQIDLFGWEVLILPSPDLNPMCAAPLIHLFGFKVLQARQQMLLCKDCK